MIQLKDLGTYEKLVSIVSIHPFRISFSHVCLPSIQWLVEHGANLNDKENPSFLLAVQYGNKESIDYVVAHGANIHAFEPCESRCLFKLLYMARNMRTLQIIHDLGHSVQKYGGKSFQKCHYK